MRLPPVRFTIRQMLVIVALTPIVLYSGWVTRFWWPVSSSSVSEILPGAGSISDELTIIEVQEFSVWPSILAMTATSILLAGIWTAIVRIREARTSRLI